MFDKHKESKTKFRSQSKSSKSSKPAALGKAPSSPTPASTGALSTSRANSSTSSDTQTEILNILQIIRSEQKKTNSRVVDTNKRINALYSEYDEEEYDENQNYDIDYYDDTGDEAPNHDNTSTTDSVSVEPPRKKQKSVATDDTTRFANMSKKCRLGENCDSPINEQLATNVTDIFGNGISQERYRDLFKDEKLTRPQNCEGLVTVQTDQMVWDILYAETKTNDNKMKNIQTAIIKSATVLSKVIDKLDKVLENDAKDELNKLFDDSMDSLALMGHANRLLCLMRRDLMKNDIKEDYGHLLNPTVSYDKFLFGGEVPKTVDDIGKCSRISSKIRGRGSFRGRRPWLRFRGRSRGRGHGRGLGRGYSPQADNYKAAAETKNSRFTHNKYRN